MKRNSSNQLKPASVLGSLVTPKVQPIVLPERPVVTAEAITVKTLADHFMVEPIAIRKVLRSLGVKPSKVAVSDGWKNQNRNQYVWASNTDPELISIVEELQKKFAAE